MASGSSKEKPWYRLLDDCYRTIGGGHLTLSLTEIFAWMTETYDLPACGKGWKTGIRYNLSKNEAFEGLGLGNWKMTDKAFNFGVKSTSLFRRADKKKKKTPANAGKAKSIRKTNPRSARRNPKPSFSKLIAEPSTSDAGMLDDATFAPPVLTPMPCASSGHEQFVESFYATRRVVNCHDELNGTATDSLGCEPSHINMGINDEIASDDDNSDPELEIETVGLRRRQEGQKRRAGRRPATQRKPYKDTYFDLVFKCMKDLGGQTRPVTLSKIYDWFGKNTDKPKGDRRQHTVEKSIRHNLSSHTVFHNLGGSTRGLWKLVSDDNSNRERTSGKKTKRMCAGTTHNSTGRTSKSVFRTRRLDEPKKGASSRHQSLGSNAAELSEQKFTTGDRIATTSSFKIVKLDADGEEEAVNHLTWQPSENAVLPVNDHSNNLGCEDDEDSCTDDVDEALFGKRYTTPDEERRHTPSPYIQEKSRDLSATLLAQAADVELSPTTVANSHTISFKDMLNSMYAKIGGEDYPGVLFDQDPDYLYDSEVGV